MGKRSKYKDLSINALLFTISSFGAKLISFLLVPLYTHVLSTTDYGQVDLMSTTVQLLIPILTLNIQDAILRFALDEEYDSEKVIGVGIKVIVISSGLLGVLLFVFQHSGIITIDYKYTMFLFFSFFLGVMNNCFSMYLKAKDRVRILTICGLLNTFLTCLFNIFFLLVLKLGVSGYLLANILGVLIAVIGMLFGGGIYKEAKLQGNVALLKKMVPYSLPLVMNSLAWWLNNASDRYILTFFCGTAVNGIYAVAYKIPTILSTFQTIFYNAWSISAIKEFDKDDSDGFIGNIYTLYSFVSVVGCSCILIANIWLAKLLYAKEFFQAWKYVPPLLLGTVFNGIALFEGCIFTAVKKTSEVSNTTLVGAVINTVFNFILIPKYGALGAAIATLLGYVLIWGIRTKKMLKIINVKVCWQKQLVSMLLLVVQTVIALNSKGVAMQFVCLIFILLVQKNVFVSIIKKLTILCEYKK